MLKLMKNSHELADMGAGSKTEAEIAYNVPADGYFYDTDEATGNKVENRFTGENLIDGYPIDGSKETTPVTYLSRSDFEGTFPKNKIVRSRNADAYAIASAIEPTAAQLAATGYANVEKPSTSVPAGISFDDMIEMVEDGYEDEFWDLFIGQISKTELFELLRDGYFKTEAIASVEKPAFTDLDGPLGLNTRVFSDYTSCGFVNYPSETLLAQTWNTDLAYALGKSVGTEARENNIRGWYGPGANIHRNPYGGRNSEYYSEDPVLSGKFTAETVRGAKNMGLYCYIKHFVVNDTESLREGLYTFLTEQTLREIYLRPFEIAVKEGGATGLMSSMNRVGATWVGASRAMLTDVLRTEWGFNGIIVTDWVDAGHGDYMPVYKGIWAGNDIWLNNADAQKLFNDSTYSENNVFVTLAQKVAHDVMWALVDAEQTRLAYDPDADMTGTSGSAELNRGWIWFIPFPACVVLLAGEGVLAFFLIKTLRRNKREEGESAVSTETTRQTE